MPQNKPIVTDNQINIIAEVIINTEHDSLLYDYWLDDKIENMRTALRRIFQLGFNDYLAEIEQND